MQANKRILFLSILLQFSLSWVLLASAVTRAAAAGTLTSAASSAGGSSSEALDPPTPNHRPKTSHGRRRKNAVGKSPFSRRLEEALVSTVNSADDDDDDQITSKNGTTVCTPMAECEICPHKWKVLVEKEDEKIKGEYESCVKYGRRRQFECTVLYRDNESSEKIARSVSEYRSCRYTDADEQYRMIRMQIICLLVGAWAMRNVSRQKVVSASLFDQRRMRLQNANGRTNVKYAPLPRKDSVEGNVELKPFGSGTKVPKSPAPNPSEDAV